MQIQEVAGARSRNQERGRGCGAAHPAPWPSKAMRGNYEAEPVRQCNDVNNDRKEGGVRGCVVLKKNYFGQTVARTLLVGH